MERGAGLVAVMEQKQVEGSGRSPGGRTAQSIVRDSKGIKLATTEGRRGEAGRDRLERSFGVRTWRPLNTRPGHGRRRISFQWEEEVGLKEVASSDDQSGGTCRREGLRPRRPENHGYGEQRGGALLGWDRKNWKGEMPKREPRDLVREKKRENSGWNPWKLTRFTRNNHSRSATEHSKHNAQYLAQGKRS